MFFLEEASSISDESLSMLLPTLRKDGSELWAVWNPETDYDPVHIRLWLPERTDVLRVELEAGEKDNPYFPDILKKEMENDYRINPDEAEHVWGGNPRKQGENAVMSRVEIRAAVNRVVEETEPDEVGVDVGRFGSDKTQMYRRRGAKTIDHKEFAKKDTQFVAKEVWEFTGKNRDQVRRGDGRGGAINCTKQKRLENAKKPVGEIIKVQGKGWASYYRDPQTGKIVWTDLPLEYQFRKRADLSTQIWSAVEEQEQKVFDVVRCSTALGRDVKDICIDLEAFINYPDGGAKVVGRWMGMFPDTKKGISDAYLHQYVEDMGLQWGTSGAHNILYEETPGGATRLREGFRQYLDERLSKVTFDEHGHAKRGSILPAAVKQYASRLGKAGLDYRAIRIARTETTAMLADEQLEIAENSDICTGEMDFVMERGRDHWNCNCEKYAEQNPWEVDDPERPEIPVHPNCMCQWRPRLKTDEEILAALKEEMAEDLETLEGTDEQEELLHRLVCPKCGLTITENSKKMRNAKHCPVCGEDMKETEQQDKKLTEFVIADKELKNEMQNESNKIYKNMSKNQNLAVDRYSTSIYENINEALFETRKADSIIAEYINSLDDIMKKAVVNDNLIVYRGTKASYYDTYDVGDNFNFKGFMSTSLDENIAVDFLSRYENPWMLEIQVPKGTSGYYIGSNTGVSKNEFELLLNRGLKFEVIEIDEVDKLMRLKVVE